MPQSDEILDMELDSSPGSETLDEAVTTPVVEADGATSSDAQPGEPTPRDTLSIVRDVVDGKAPPAEAASPAEGSEEAKADAPAPKEQDNENYSDVPFNKHPRFQKLISERNELRTDAGRYRNVQGFLESNGVSAEEGAEALTIAALAKTDPAGTWERIKPWVQNLLVAAGEVLPEELSQRVQQGELSHAAAVELSRSKARVQSIETRQTFEQQRAQEQNHARHVQSLQSTAESWEADRKAKDPNFAAKEPDLMREIAYLQRNEGRPDTADGVKDQLKRAYEAVNGRFRAPTPPPRPRRELKPVTGGQINGSARPEGGSTLDIIRAHTRR